VRTITVPAIAALLGRASWWPSRPWDKERSAGDPHEKKTVFDAVMDT
jgi:RND superfamily putative drug exporter